MCKIFQQLQVKLYKLPPCGDKGREEGIYKKLRKVNDKKWSLSFTICIAIGVAAIIFGGFKDYEQKNKDPSENNNARMIEIMQNNFDDLYNLATSLSSISGAVVILFYSVMDNRKEGIPHRRVMAFSFGSHSVPVLFIISIFLLLFGYISGITEHLYLSSFIWIYIMAMQFLIIYRILRSTSYEFCINKIQEMEMSQLITYLDNEDEARKIGRSLDPYFIHYIDIAMSSGEITYEKIELTRKIFEIPFLMKEEGRDLSVSQLYHFYHENLEIACKHLSDNSLNSLYNYLFELVYKWISNYENEDKIYAVISAIWNSVLISSIEGAESFCIELLNKIMQTKHLHQEKVITLYFMSLEYAFRRDEKNLRKQHLERINGFYDWNFNIERDSDMCRTHWEIWMEHVSLRNSAQEYLNDALDTLSNQTDKSVQLSYILSIRNHRGNDE